jgi:hypothetical protein
VYAHQLLGLRELWCPSYSVFLRPRSYTKVLIESRTYVTAKLVGRYFPVQSESLLPPYGRYECTSEVGDSCPESARGYRVRSTYRP